MGQAMQKLQGKGSDEQKQKKKEEIEKTISTFVDKNQAEIEAAIKSLDGFYHVVYNILEELSKQSGTVQLTLRRAAQLEEAYNHYIKKNKQPGEKLNKEDFKNLIKEAITLDSISVGEGARDIFLFIFGIPILTLMAKRVIPGPTKMIPDDFFIPATTSATVVMLAKTNKL